MQSLSLTLTGFVAKLLRFSLARVMQFERFLHKATHWNNQSHYVIKSTKKYNMMTAADEQYYAAQYWQRIHGFLQKAQIKPQGHFLDLGCGQGRLTLPLAKWCAEGGTVSGIDISEHAIQQAKNYAAEQKLENIKFYTADIVTHLQQMPDHSLEAVVMLEVIFFLPHYQKALAEIARVLKPNGLLIASFRSQYFNLLHSMQHGLWPSVPMILNERSGAILQRDMLFNWHTLPELKTMLEQDYHFQLKHVSGIGVCSGIPGDPHAAITRPSSLSQHEQRLLIEAEEQLAERVPEAGRYMLVIAQLSEGKNL